MIKKKSLGRGLDALLPSIPEEKNKSADGYPLLVNINSILKNPDQPRQDFKESELISLSESIKVKGIIEPLIVRVLDGDKYELIAGERRLRASKLANLKQVPVIIRDMSDDPLERLELALIENLCREDLNPIEEAESYHKLEKQFGRTQSDIAKISGRDRSTITNTIRLLKLPKSIQDDLRHGRLTPGHGRAMLGLEDETLMLDVRVKVLSANLTVRQTEALVKKLKKADLYKSQQNINFGDQAYFDALSQAFTANLGGMKVKINNFGKVKKLEIFYKSNEELEQLMKKFNIGPL